MIYLYVNWFVFILFKVMNFEGFGKGLFMDIKFLILVNLFKVSFLLEFREFFNVKIVGEKVKYFKFI